MHSIDHGRERNNYDGPRRVSPAHVPYNAIRARRWAYATPGASRLRESDRGSPIITLELPCLQRRSRVAGKIAKRFLAATARRGKLHNARGTPPLLCSGIRSISASEMLGVLSMTL